jgi:hypothetical protein
MPGAGASTQTKVRVDTPIAPEPFSEVAAQFLHRCDKIAARPGGRR